MNIILIGFTAAIIVPRAILIIIYILSIRSNNDREKLSPFECGFDPNHTARIPFSTRFFLLAIIFIVFDIELVLLIPIPIILINYNSLIILTSLLFLLILLIGLLHEWNQGSINWSY